MNANKRYSSWIYMWQSLSFTPIWNYEKLQQSPVLLAILNKQWKTLSLSGTLKFNSAFISAVYPGVKMGNKKCWYGFHNQTGTIPTSFTSSGEVPVCFQPARRGTGMAYSYTVPLRALCVSLTFDYSYSLNYMEWTKVWGPEAWIHFALGFS